MKEGDKENIFKGYVVIPKGLTIEQREVFVYLYEKCNFKDMTVEYTVANIVADIDKRLELTTMKVRTILKNFISKGYIVNILRGAKGKPSVLKIITIKQQLSNNYITNKNVQPSHLKEVCNNNITPIQQLSNNSIKEKEKETIYSHWNSKKIIVHKKMTSEIVKAIDKALKNYSVNEIVQAINNYSQVINDNNYFFNYKWSLKNFLTRSNGISNFTSEGSTYINYLTELKKSNKQNSNNRELEERLL